MPTTVRLDPTTEDLLTRLTKRTGRTKSEVIREAIHKLAAAEVVRQEDQSVYERWLPFIGVAKGGPPDLSERTGEKFAKLLRERRRS